MTILYGVKFLNPVDCLPGRAQKGIPGTKSWADWPGWSIQVKGTRVLITAEPMDLSDENQSGILPGGRDEHEANVGDKTMRPVYSVPINECILLYLDADPKGKASQERSPTPALLEMLEERKKTPPPKVVVPPTAYQGPAVTPMRAVANRPTPPASPRPVEPPPSTIIMDDEEDAS